MAATTKAERDQLCQLIRKREKVMRARAVERSAALLAEFEAQSAKIHSYDDDPVWQAAQAEATKAVQIAQQSINRRCEALGIPREFSPQLGLYWQGHGHNAVAYRREELRRAAKAKIALIETEALTRIETLSLEAQTEVVSSGLESDAARAFLAAMPDLSTLMPTVEFTEIQSLLEAKKRERPRGWTPELVSP